MTTFNVLLAVHVTSVVWWIGGVALVTFALLPAVNGLPDQARIERIQQFERRFAWQARIAVLLVGITGFWMLAITGGLARLGTAWWLDLMLLVWLLFAFLLFIAEPLGLPKRIGLMRSRRGFFLLHAVMLTLALAAVFCGVIGARGGFGY